MRESSAAGGRVVGETVCFNPIAVICSPCRRCGQRTALPPGALHARHVWSAAQRASSLDGAQRVVLRGSPLWACALDSHLPTTQTLLP